MATNPNMVAIQTVTVGSGGAANIEFTNIPQTYTDLVVKFSLRSSADTVDAKISFNGVTTNLSGRVLEGNGSGASSFSHASDVYSLTNRSTYTANTFGSGEIYIPNYAGSNNKSISQDVVTENNATLAYMYLTAGLWSSSSAITSVKLAPTTGNFAQYSTATLYGITSAGYGAKATGGIITSDANYFYHTFLSSGTFTPTQNLTADYLVVAGGGSAGSNNGENGSGGGGGGAGGYRLLTAQSLTASTNYTVTIGAGGASNSSSGNGNIGSDSVFGSTTSTGGGRGAGGGGAVAGGNGGSGGGGHGTGAGGTGTSGQGNNGGGSNYSAPAYGSGGGGGSNAAGSAGTSSSAGAGGAGTASSISGTSITYAVGGNGGRDSGGGAVVQGTAGAANTGNGGSGGQVGTPSTTVAVGGAGGSGIVIVRYAR